MDLKQATTKDIQDELARRRMLAHEADIKKLVEEICIAYNTGRIAVIKTESRDVGTSEETKTYFVHMK